VEGTSRFGYTRPPPAQARLDLTLPRHPAALSMARRELARCFASRLSEPLMADVTIAANELVGNALEHGVGAIHLQAQDVQDHLRLEVSDEGNGFLAPRHPDSHKGLAIIDSVTTKWGVNPGSTHVWCHFEIAGPRRAGSPAAS